MMQQFMLQVVGGYAAAKEQKEPHTRPVAKSPAGTVGKAIIIVIREVLWEVACHRHGACRLAIARQKCRETYTDNTYC
jgi:hypothetical protein